MCSYTYYIIMLPSIYGTDSNWFPPHFPMLDPQGISKIDAPDLYEVSEIDIQIIQKWQKP